ncbi:MAG: 50S ribosomal protein L25 [Minisyncoccia bacterium]|jgi:large subunit ribosomal protein L25
MDLAVTERVILGKKVKALRKTGIIPAELYGHGVPNVHLSVSAKDFAKIYKEAGENTVVMLGVGKEKRPAIIHHVVKHYLSGEPSHIDFYQVRMDEKITAHVPLEFVGDSAAVKDKGAVINRSMTEIEVEALPNDLPRHLTVDLSLLDDINKTIHVRDIVLPRGVTVLIEEDTAVASAQAPRVEEVVAAPVVDVTTVKSEAEEKVAERAAAKPEAGAGAEKK